jgi:surfeit locus 1 family protein
MRLPTWVRALVLAALLVAALTMIGLGVWQLGRLQERRALNADIRRRLSEPPLALDGSSLADAAQWEYRRVIVRGVFDFSQEIVQRNRAHQQAPGVHVITPLKIAGSATAILVDRGWIPYESGAPAARAAYQTPAGEVAVEGVLRASQTRPYPFLPADPTRGPDDSRLDQWYWLNVEQIQQQIPYPLLPMFVELAPSEPAGPIQLPISGYEIDLSDGPHLSYAIQWFAFAAIAVVGPLAYWVQQRRR